MKIIEEKMEIYCTPSELVTVIKSCTENGWNLASTDFSTVDTGSKRIITEYIVVFVRYPEEKE